MFFAGVLDESDAESGAGCGDDPQIGVRLRFAGERRGVLLLSVSAAAARTLAADFLGEEQAGSPSNEQVLEVVKELANMICGYALSALERESLHLAAPEVVPAAALAWSVPCRRSFRLDNGSLTIGLEFQDARDE
jgi:CheY-specific phosphatase CheX